jgi:hypothetical protein
MYRQEQGMSLWGEVAEVWVADAFGDLKDGVGVVPKSVKWSEGAGIALVAVATVASV